VKAAAFACVILIMWGNASLIASPLANSMGELNLTAPPDQLVQVQVNKKKKIKKYRREAQGPPYIPGWVLTPYGRKDCIGRWHWHEDRGWYHCHGQLISPW
jgi:hypothetical protein